MKFFTVEEVAELLRVSRSRVYQLGRERLLPIVRIGRQVRVEEGALRRWIEEGGQALPGGWRGAETDVTRSVDVENPS